MTPRRLALLSLLLIGCGGGDPLPDAGPDASPDASADAMSDASPDAMSDASPDAAADAQVDAAPSTDPVIATVATSDGFTQLRQGAFATLVITGERLAGTTAVTLGALSTTITSVTATEVRAEVAIPHGHAPGPLPLTVTTDHGTATRAAAITVTFLVTAADGSVEGRGTYQSPTLLCSVTQDLVTAGDTLELLAGEHRCDRQITLDAGVAIRGAGAGQTLIRGQAARFGGFSIMWVDPRNRTRMTGLTVIDPAGRVLLSEHGAGGVVIDDVEVRGGPAGSAAIEVFDYEEYPLREVIIQRFRYDGAGDAIRIDAARDGRIVDSVLRGGASGVTLGYGGTLTIERSRIEGFDVGVAIGTGIDVLVFPPDVSLVDAVLVDNALGILVADGTARLLRTEIVDEPTTARACATGIRVDQGDAWVNPGSRIACTDTGVLVSPRGLSDPSRDTFGSLYVDGGRIEGGRIGIDFIGWNNDSGLRLQRARVRGGTVAAVRIADELRFELGDRTAPGDNDFSVDSPSAFALLDRRSGEEVGWEVQAIGTTLNGRSYAGQTIIGPKQQAPDYSIRAGSWEF